MESTVVKPAFPAARCQSFVQRRIAHDSEGWVRLKKTSGALFGSIEEELIIAAVGSKIEFARTELKLAQSYVDRAYTGAISITMNDGSNRRLNASRFSR
jgi:hypothetical protein